jgi:hypothetical protein
MANTLALGASAARLAGSSPAFRTKKSSSQFTVLSSQFSVFRKPIGASNLADAGTAQDALNSRYDKTQREKRYLQYLWP